MIRWAGAATVTCLLLIGAGKAAADGPQEARCFTTDDGAYSCHMRVDPAGDSIEIMAPGRPTYVLQMTGSDEAIGFAVLAGETVRLPATFLRRPDDPGCWHNTETMTEICVW